MNYLQTSNEKGRSQIQVYLRSREEANLTDPVVMGRARDANHLQHLSEKNAKPIDEIVSFIFVEGIKEFTILFFLVDHWVYRN